MDFMSKSCAGCMDLRDKFTKFQITKAAAYLDDIRLLNVLSDFVISHL